MRSVLLTYSIVVDVEDGEDPIQAGIQYVAETGMRNIEPDSITDLDD